MSKSHNFAILIAGALGIIGFFMPLFSVTINGLTGEFSTDALVLGIERVSDHFPALTTDADEAGLKVQGAVAEMNYKLRDVRTIFATVFFPSALLLFWGFCGVVVGYFGRGLEVLSLLSGLAAVGIYALVIDVIRDLEIQASASTGAHMVAVSGALGLVFGLIAVLRPDSAGVRKKRKRRKSTVLGRA